MADAFLSSPDPLNDSPTFYGPPKPRRSSRTGDSVPHQSTSPKKQTFELDVGNDLSPQKIRVTVEAGDAEGENAYTTHANGRDESPLNSRALRNRRRERTTTTTVPVKGLSDSEEEETEQIQAPKRGRGRPRKSAATPVSTKKRVSTPTRKISSRRKSFGELVDGDDDEDINFQVGKSVEIGRGKGGSRSRSRKGTARKSTPTTKQPSEKVVSSTASKKGRGRRKTLLPEEVVVLEDERNRASRENSGLDDEAQMSGALLPMDANEAYPPLNHSTIRSTSTVQSDVLIARFNPGNETPRRTGWSSPRILDAPSELHSNESVSERASHSDSRGNTNVACDEEIEAFPSEDEGLDAPEHDDSQDYHQYQDEEGEEGEEGEDEVGEMREFDTILESEGFSMISVDSVPSLREHLSSPVTMNLVNPSTTPIRNKSLLSIQNMDATHNDSFSSIPEEILVAATPGRKGPNSRPLSLQVSRVDASFSSIAPEILKAATPSRVSSSANLSVPTQNDEDYEESFSAIPQSILDAATPAPKPESSFKSDISAQTRSPSRKPTILSVGPKSSTSSVPNTTQSPRLLTPEETPSPNGDSNQETSLLENSARLLESSRQTEEEKLQNEASIAHSQLPSSPPSLAPRRYTYTAHLRQHPHLHQGVAETPSIIFSSPSLPPPLQQQRAQAASNQILESHQRPALSPIIQTGRALQGLHIPSSPRSRSQSLGSPFKSPAADRKSSSIARETQAAYFDERRAKPLPRLDLGGNLAALSSQKNNSTRSALQDDPFSNTASSQRPPSPEEKQKYALGLPSQQRLSDSRFNNIRSDVSVRSDDVMSWQAEEEVSTDNKAASMRNNANSSVNVRGSSSKIVSDLTSSGRPGSVLEQKWAAERAAVSRQIAAADPSEVVVIESDDDNVENGDDEDFGLLLETMNSSSPVVWERQEQLIENLEKPRRSKLPSPWRKNSKRLVYSDELSKLGSSPITSRVTLTKDTANDISKDTDTRPVTVRRIVMDQEGNDDTEADLSGWQIPQKSNFKPRPRENIDAEISALLKSPAAMLPVLSKSSRNTSTLLDMKPVENTMDVHQSSITSNSSEQRPFAPIPQKMGFRPRARSEVSESFLSSPVKPHASGLFGDIPQGSSSSRAPISSPSPIIPLGISHPSKTNVPLANIHTPVQPSSADYLDDSTNSLNSNEEKENQATASRTLKWTETVHLASKTVPTAPPLTSPTKSCLRSPLKTPSANSGFGSGSVSPSKGVTFVSSSPMPSSPPSKLLSSTTWSKSHWHLLSSILESWKPTVSSSPSPPGSDTSSTNTSGRGKSKRRNSTRVISKLLGKTLMSKGESMVLEQWHLEAVDDFRGEVPGWEESVVALRVFSLMCGEKKRGYSGWE